MSPCLAPKFHAARCSLVIRAFPQLMTAVSVCAEGHFCIGTMPVTLTEAPRDARHAAAGTAPSWCRSSIYRSCIYGIGAWCDSSALETICNLEYHRLKRLTAVPLTALHSLRTRAGDSEGILPTERCRSTLASSGVMAVASAVASWASRCAAGALHGRSEMDFYGMLAHSSRLVEGRAAVAAERLRWLRRQQAAACASYLM